MNRVYNSPRQGAAPADPAWQAGRASPSSEIRDILDLYDHNDGGAVQMSKSARRSLPTSESPQLKAQRDDIDGAIQAT